MPSGSRSRCSDRHVTPDVLGEVLPGQCRLALEASLQESARRTLLGTSLDHPTIEKRISAAHELTDLAALALFGERRDKSEVYQEIGRRLGAGTADAIRSCNQGTHVTIPDVADAKAFIERVATATEGLRSL